MKTFIDFFARIRFNVLHPLHSRGENSPLTDCDRNLKDLRTGKWEIEARTRRVKLSHWIHDGEESVRR